MLQSACNKSANQKGASMSRETPSARILVLANETADTDTLAKAIGSAARKASTTEVLVVAPALNSRLRFWCSDEDDARHRAEERLQGCVERLASAGITATGRIGDADPQQAARDALVTFDADLLIIATHPEGKSNWLEARLVERAGAWFPGRVVHVPVDVASERHLTVAV
jgi:hypothetical protein